MRYTSHWLGVLSALKPGVGRGGPGRASREEVAMSAYSKTTEILAARCQALLIALAADALLGDPPNACHPVVLLGGWMRLGERLAPRGARARLGWGAFWVAGGAVLVGGTARLLPRHVVVQGLAASTLLAYRSLDRAVGAVQAALEAGDLDEARRLASWHLVSRPTAELRADEVAAAAIESLAENLSDSLVAPALAYLGGGLPALAVYRLVNTADAMWGYRDERYEYLGKAAARLDDALNLAPARLTAALIALAAQISVGRGGAAWHVARRDAGRTASPNAGWPMAAMAGALDTTLTKRDHYRLGDGPRAPDAALVGEARRIARTLTLLVVAGLLPGASIRVVWNAGASAPGKRVAGRGAQGPGVLARLNRVMGRGARRPGVLARLNRVVGRRVRKVGFHILLNRIVGRRERNASKGFTFSGMGLLMRKKV